MAVEKEDLDQQAKNAEPTTPAGKKNGPNSSVQNGSDMFPARTTRPTDIAAGSNEPSEPGGEGIFEKSLSMILADEGSPQKRIELLTEALQYGLSLEDEIAAHAFLGAELFQMEKDDEGISHYEHSLKLSRNCISMFTDDTMMLLCRRLCLKYISNSRKIAEEEGNEKCLSFLESKLSILKDLSSPALFFELSTLLTNCGNVERASIYLEKAANGRIVDDMDRETINTAKSSLSKILKKGETTHDETIKKTETERNIPIPEIADQEKVVAEKETLIISPKGEVANNKKKTRKKYAVAAVIAGILIGTGVLSSFHFVSSKPKHHTIPILDKVESKEPVEVVKPVKAPRPPTNLSDQTEQSRPEQKANLEKRSRRAKKPSGKMSGQVEGRPANLSTGKSFAPHSRDDL